MITAAHAQSEALRIKDVNINPSEQMEEIEQQIKEAVKLGKTATTFYQVIHSENLTKLTEKGFRWSSGYGSDAKGYFIKWS